MENQSGICSSCGMAVNLPHDCTADHKFLGTTDWQIRRYKDQVELGIVTSLSAEEYTKLQGDRQVSRDKISQGV